MSKHREALFLKWWGHMKIKNQLKNWKKLSNASYASFLVCVIPDFVRPFQNKNLVASLKTRQLKKDLFRTQSRIQTKHGGVSAPSTQGIKHQRLLKKKHMLKK